MGNDGLAKFQFEGYTIEKINLLRKGQSTTDEASVKFNVSINEGHDVNRFRLIVGIWVENPGVDIDVTISGVFKFDDDGEITKEEKVNTIKLNGFAILLPYIRSIISVITALDGPTAVILPIINVFEMMNDNIDNESDKSNANEDK